jgi:ABC-2 type transport system ATP-binding protein
MKTLLYLSISFSESAELYIFDEPTWGLDPLMRDEVLEEIRKIAGNGKTVFYTSHILPEVEKVVDKIAIMNRGKILFEDYLDSAKENFKKVVVPKNTNTDKYTPVYETEINDMKVLYLYKKEEIEELTKIYPDIEITNMNLEKIFQAIVRGDKYDS